MRHRNFLLTLVSGISLGAFAAQQYLPRGSEAIAAGTDRYQDYILATGAVSLNARTQLDGVWLLDYRSGKLLGSCVDKSQGKMMPWAEVDLVSEFQVAPKQDVHFTMTTGYIAPGQSALYIAETSTGQFGVYTMAAGPNSNGVVIRRHDLSSFRNITEAPPAPGTPLPLAEQPEELVPPPAATSRVPYPSVVPTQILPPATAIPAPIQVPPALGLPRLPPPASLPK